MISLYTSLMAHHQTAASSGVKHIYFPPVTNTADKDIIAHGDAEPSATPDWQEWDLLRESYC